MKRFLLIALAALTMTANAQSSKREAAGKPQSRTLQQQQKATLKKDIKVAGAKKGAKAVLDKSSRQLKAASSLRNSLKPAASKYVLKADGTVQAKYEGSGQDAQDGAVEWEMLSGVSTEDASVTILRNVIPTPFNFDVDVVYTLAGNTISIAPQLAASGDNTNSPTGKMYVYLIDATSADGTITLNIDANGNITGTYDILYGAFSKDDPTDMNSYLGYYSYVSNVKYNLPGVIVAPTVSFEQSNLVLFASLGLNGYQFHDNLAFTSAYAPLSFSNLTTDKATAWSWSANKIAGYDAQDNPVTEVAGTGTDKDFTLDIKAGAYTDIQLIGTNQTAISDPFSYGIGKSFEDTGEPSYDKLILYGGGYESEFTLNNETNAIITRQDPDGDIKFYTNWGTPDIYTSTSMHTLYLYHEKPAKPLYIEGVTLPFVSWKLLNQEGTDLHVKIYKASYPAGATRFTLGDLIAESDVTNINDAFDKGLTGVEFADFYTEDEWGMSTGLDHLFIDSEFVIVIENWDSGTFSGVLGSQDAPLSNARTSTWFEKTGEEGSRYSYTSWKTSLFVGFLGATMGYLETEDATDIVLPAEGGKASITVSPMFTSTNESGATSTRLFLEDNYEIPEWLLVSIANEKYGENDDITFDLVVEALPLEGEPREAELVFFQEGAQLTINVKQGGDDTEAITTVTTSKADGKTYNIAGQPTKRAKGIVVSDGKKYVVK